MRLGDSLVSAQELVRPACFSRRLALSCTTALRRLSPRTYADLHPVSAFGDEENPPSAEPLPITMYWTLELAAHLEDAPWPATKDELIDYADRTGAPLEVTQNLLEIEDDGEPYESIEEVWPDYPTTTDDFYYEEE